MFKRALILAGVVLAAVAFASFKDFGSTGSTAEAEKSSTSDQPKGIKRHAFLNGLDLGEDGNGHALILHGLATDGDVRAITDPDALRAAQGKAYYTDNPREQGKMLILSLLFLSPAGMPPDSQFATVVRNKEVVEHFRCYVPFCSGSQQFDPPHERDLAGLLEASQPVERLIEKSLKPEDIRAFHFKALRDDRIVQIDPPDLPPPNTVIFPKRIRLSLPPVLLETGEFGEEPLVPFDEDDYRARFTAAFEHAYPQTEAYRLGKIGFSTSYPPLYGWPVVSDEFDGYLRDDKDELRGIKRLMMKQPYLSISLSETMAANLMAPDAFAAMPEFAREPDGLSDQLDALALEVLGRPCPDCFKIELPVDTVDVIKPREVAPTEYYLSYLRIMDK
ncbi:MAG: hypothetical protein AB8B82_08620 [Roseovarius sp.]